MTPRGGIPIKSNVMTTSYRSRGGGARAAVWGNAWAWRGSVRLGESLALWLTLLHALSHHLYLRVNFYLLFYR
jgi:hypothetical protein